MTVLAWLKSKELFLKIQEGTGDNLSDEDLEKGFVDYVLWSTFRADDLDIDGELGLKLSDGGMVMFKEPTYVEDAIEACYHSAFNTSLPPDGVFILQKGNR